MTYLTPTGDRDGSVIVPRSAIVAGSNRTMSATLPGAITPRSAKPRNCAVADVIFRIASGNERSRFSRTYLPRMRGKVPKARGCEPVGEPSDENITRGLAT